MDTNDGSSDVGSDYEEEDDLDGSSPEMNTPEKIEGDNLSKYLFKVKEENKLTRTCVQQIATVTEKLLQGAVNRIKRNVEQCLSNDGVDSTKISGFDAVFSDEVLDYSDVMVSNLETFHKREDINIPYVVSKIL